VTGDLIDVALAAGPVEVRGALDLVGTADGLLPRRLPAWTRSRMPDPSCAMVVAQPSGVRLAFRTAATTVELDVRITRTHYVDAPEPQPAGTFEVTVDGRVVRSAAAPDGGLLVLAEFTAAPRVVPGAPATVRFGPLPPGVKDVEIWLPHAAQVELIAMRADAPVTGSPPPPGPRWVHHGSSISHCAEAAGPLGTWPVVAARIAGADLVNLGLGGNSMVDPFTARAIRDLPADVISLKLGINVINADAMRLRAFVPAVHGFLDTVRDGHPDAPLLVVSPIMCPIVEELPGPTVCEPDGAGVRFRSAGDPAQVAQGALTLAIIRDVLRDIVAARAATDPRLHYLDGRDLFGAGDVADLVDALHPNAAGYQRMGERFAAAVFGGDGPFAGARRAASAA
jgi:hypothetical protein